MKKIIKKFFDPLSVAQANMVPVLLDRMQLFGITINELDIMYDEWMVAKKDELKQQAQSIEFKVREPRAASKVSKGSDKCAKCGARVRKHAVNVSKCTKVGGNFKTAIQCTNRECLHTEYK